MKALLWYRSQHTKVRAAIITALLLIGFILFIFAILFNPFFFICLIFAGCTVLLVRTLYDLVLFYLE